MGTVKLARSLGLPTEFENHPKWGRREVGGPEAMAFKRKFNDLVPFIDQLSEKCKTRARRKGEIVTLLGRHCRFPLDEARSYPGRPPKYDWVFKALNRLIQGSAADQTKQALVDVARAGYPVQLQVHDELDLTVSSPSEAYAVAEIMRDCVQLEVPSVVDVELGESWGSIEAGFTYSTRHYSIPTVVPQ